MEIVVRQSSGSSWAYFAFACSIAVACAGSAAGAQRGGGHDAGGQHGGGHGADGDRGEGRKGGSQKGADANPSPSSRSSSVEDDGTSITAGAAVGAGQSLGLPPALQSAGDSSSSSAVSPIRALPGVPDEVVRACRDAIEMAAAPFGAASVRVSSAGFPRQVNPDVISAPIKVSIDYVRQGNVETRQAPIKCELNANGSVIGLT
ncbi:MAG: hypothetical protein E5X73_35415 [Mesorhizobium sp.]|nr:MAG: hypothetical protein E5X73_35415 [Mesorhizobium sp.]